MASDTRSQRHRAHDVEDLYDVLQISPRAEPEVIEAAFRRLARKYHPDTTVESASSERMKALSHAYETLSDPTRRAAYDSTLSPARTRGQRGVRASAPLESQDASTRPRSGRRRSTLPTWERWVWIAIAIVALFLGARFFRLLAVNGPLTLVALTALVFVLWYAWRAYHRQA